MKNTMTTATLLCYFLLLLYFELYTPYVSRNDFIMHHRYTMIISIKTRNTILKESKESAPITSANNNNNMNKHSVGAIIIIYYTVQYYIIIIIAIVIIYNTTTTKKLDFCSSSISYCHEKEPVKTIMNGSFITVARQMNTQRFIPTCTLLD